MKVIYLFRPCLNSVELIITTVFEAPIISCMEYCVVCLEPVFQYVRSAAARIIFLTGNCDHL